MIAIVVGTRPEIIKMSPIIKACERQKLDYFILHTGQHYSYNMDKVFFEQLDLPEPKRNLNSGSNTDVQEIAGMMFGLEGVLSDEKPDMVLVEGDTHTVLATALVASKLHIKIGHVESGLRSYDRRMQEEINRILTDHCSDYLFAPTEHAKGILAKEGIIENVFMTGNTIVDVVKAYKKEKTIGNYVLATIHRHENVDNRDKFCSILKGLDAVKWIFGLPVIYPVHPRAKKMMAYFGLKCGLEIVEPMDYFSFLEMEGNARLVLTDSGGVQEEACILGVPCVTLRDNTERPETLDIGANVLAGVSVKQITKCASTMLAKKNTWGNPYGDGRTGEKIVDIIRRSNG